MCRAMWEQAEDILVSTQRDQKSTYHDEFRKFVMETRRMDPEEVMVKEPQLKMQKSRAL